MQGESVEGAAGYRPARRWSPARIAVLVGIAAPVAYGWASFWEHRRWGWWLDPDDVFGIYFAVALAALQLLGAGLLFRGTGRHRGIAAVGSAVLCVGSLLVVATFALALYDRVEFGFLLIRGPFTFFGPLIAGGVVPLIASAWAFVDLRQPAMEPPLSGDTVALALLAFVLVTAGDFVMTPFRMCVVEGAMVETPSGSRPIEALRVGDAVCSRSPDGAIVASRVTARFAHRAPGYLEVWLENGGGVEVTPEHPLYVEGRWIPAGELQPGDLVRCDGKPCAVRKIRACRRSAVVIDLTVSPNANFFADGVLVHNKQPPRKPEWVVPMRFQQLLDVQELIRDGEREHFAEWSIGYPRRLGGGGTVAGEDADYLFLVYGPSSTGLAQGTAGPVLPGPSVAAGEPPRWCAYAWPLRRRWFKQPVYFIDWRGEIYLSDMEVTSYAGVGSPPAPGAAYDKSGRQPQNLDAAIAHAGSGLTACDGNTWRSLRETR